MASPLSMRVPSGPIRPVLVLWAASIAGLGLSEAWKGGLLREGPLVAASRERLGRPGQTDGNLRFAVAGDSGAGSARWRRILDRIERDRPLFLAHVGDIAYRHATDLYFFRSLFRPGIPCLVAPGDHDSDTPDRRILYGRLIGERTFHVDLPEVRLVFLDTGTEALPAGAARRLDQEVAGAGERPVLVFLHVPPFDPRGRRHGLEDTPERARLLEVLRERRDRILAVFAGHRHGRYVAEVEGIPLQVSGGGGKDVDPGHPFHYLRVTLRGAGLEVETVTDDGPAGWADRLRELRWGAIGLWLRFGWIAFGGLSALGLALLARR